MEARPTFEYLTKCSTSKFFYDFEAALQYFLSVWQHDLEMDD